MNAYKIRELLKQDLQKKLEEVELLKKKIELDTLRINEIHKLLDEIKIEDVKVSDTAIIQYLQKNGLINKSEIINQILTDNLKEAINLMGNNSGKVYCDGYTYIIKKQVLVAIVLDT